MIHWAAIWLAKLFFKGYSGFSLPLGQDGTDTKCDYNLFSSPVTQRWSYRPFPTLVILNEPRTVHVLPSSWKKRLIIIFWKRGPKKSNPRRASELYRGSFKMNREVQFAPLFPPSLQDLEARPALFGWDNMEHHWLGEQEYKAKATSSGLPLY